MPSNAPIAVGIIVEFIDHNIVDVRTETVFQGEVSEGAGEGLLDIDGAMLERLKQLVATEPLNAGYKTALGIYTGDMDAAVDLFLDRTTPIPSYVRGDRADVFALAERLYWLKKARLRMVD